MKSGLVFLGLISFALACQDQHEVGGQQKLPIREIYRKLEMDEPLGVKTFTYDKSGNMLVERYVDERFPEANYEIRNEYDASGNKTKLIHSSEEPSHLNTVEFAYEAGKLKMEIFYQGDFAHSRIEYFYNNLELVDSTRHFYLHSKLGFQYNFTTHYRYFEGKLVKEWRKGTNVDFISKLNRYDGDLLIETCNPVTNMELVENCVRNSYTAAGQLYRVYSTFTGTPDKLLEQYSYRDNRLTEKLVFDQGDYLPPYNPDPARYTILVHYEYE